MTQILFGAGTTARVIVRDLKARGEPLPVLVDNDPAKHGQVMEGVEVLSPDQARERYPDATWTASVIRPERTEIQAQMEQMGVRTVPVWGFLPKQHALPSPELRCEIAEMLLHDAESSDEWWDQIAFRENPDYSKQRPPSDINEIYFPDFFTRLDREHFVDAGACEGDTITAFLARWPKWDLITAFEPDASNFTSLQACYGKHDRINIHQSAVSDHAGTASFVSTGDMSSHIGDGEHDTALIPLDAAYFRNPPTFIKMDIEGSELEALWGARRILEQYKPVLAVCAYHTAEHLWQIPLLIHALQPEYRLYFRRYAQGTFELCWYAVPPERLA